MSRDRCDEDETSFFTQEDDGGVTEALSKQEQEGSGIDSRRSFDFDESQNEFYGDKSTDDIERWYKREDYHQFRKEAV